MLLRKSCLALAMALAASVCGGNLMAQTFFNYSPSLVDRKDYVDSLLVMDEPPGSLPVGTEKWPVVYYEIISKAKPVVVKDEGNWDVIDTDTYKDPKTGRKVRYEMFTEPVVYYAIMDIPGGKGRFYGLVTTGYDAIETVISKPKSKWHPFTEVIPIVGTVVKPDGTREKFMIHSDSEWEQAKVSKPAGSYWLHNYVQKDPELTNYTLAVYDDVNLVFNANGTGTITMIPRVSKNVFSSYMGGSVNRKNSAGKIRKKATVIQGGTLCWQNTTRRAMKWSVGENGDITVIPTGPATLTFKEWVEHPRHDRSYYSSKSDSILSCRQVESDLKNVHEDAAEYRVTKKKTDKEHADKFPTLVIKPIHLTKKDGYVTVDGKTHYLDGNKTGVMDNYSKVIFDDLDRWEKEAQGRSFGADKSFRDMKERIKLFVSKNYAYFGVNPNYFVNNINPITRTATIYYVLPNKLMSSDFTVRQDGSIDLEALKAAAVDKSFVGFYKNGIERNNEAIMAYKKDKKRGKIVKNYEKEYKKIVIPTDFTTLAEYNDIIDRQKTLYNRQEALLKELE